MREPNYSEKSFSLFSCQMSSPLRQVSAR